MYNLLIFRDEYREDFRKQYKEKHPNNKSVAAVSIFFLHQIRNICEFRRKFDLVYDHENSSQVGKAGGDKWKSLSESVSNFFRLNNFFNFFLYFLD